MIILQTIGILFFTALIHEAGHALAARYYRQTIHQVMIWQGSYKYRIGFTVKRCMFLLGWFPYGGFVMAFNSRCQTSPAQNFFITFWGPLANLLAASGYFFTGNPVWQLFFVFNLVTAINSLLPFSKQKDGYRLLQILKQWYLSKKLCR